MMVMSKAAIVSRRSFTAPLFESYKSLATFSRNHRQNFFLIKLTLILRLSVLLLTVVAFNVFDR